MYDKLNGIVLNVLKYSDKNSIAHILTDKRGRMAFLVPQGSTKSARMRNAIFMPLSVIQLEARLLPGRELASFRDARCAVPLTGIYSNPVKTAIAMFISELLSRSIQESEKNQGLYRFLEASIRLLESMEDGVANFHICFLYNLGVFLGIQPDVESYREGTWFDMYNGVFTPRRPMHNQCLNPQDARIIVLLSRMTFANLHRFKFTHVQRNTILDTALNYYQLHNSMIGSLKSPDILRQLFA